MATKLQLMSELSLQTTKNLTHSIDDWLSFLDSAAWLYKYPFPEQVLIHAQRPDARACASMELWNSPRFNRWVNKGAKGIALIDDSGEKPRLRYVFDVSDTNTRFNTPFSLWQQKEQNEEQIIEELANHFGEPDNLERYPFEDQLIGIIHNAVSDNSADYGRELLRSLDGSFLAEYDDFNVQVWFEQVVEQSVAYCTLKRLGIEPTEYLDKSDFVPIMDFNTPATISQLGTATADMTEMVLRQIERTVFSIRRQERDSLANGEIVLQNEDRISERSTDYGTGLQTERGLSDSRHRDGYAADGEYWQVRENEESLPERAPEGLLQQPAIDERTVAASLRDRQDSESADRADNEHDGEIRGRDGEPESIESDGVGSADEQYQEPSREDDLSRPDLWITEEQPEEAESKELPAFTSGELILPMLTKAYYTKGHKNVDIQSFFALHHDEAERTQFIKDAFDEAYCEVMVDDHRVGYKKQPIGLLIWDGAYLTRKAESVFSWDIVVSLIEDLIERREFVKDELLSLFPTLEEQIARIEQAEAEKTSAFSVSQADFDYELTKHGSGFASGKLRIYKFYEAQPSTDAAIKFLKNEYGIGGHSHTYLDGSQGFVDHDGKGLRFSDKGFKNKHTYPWRIVERRIRELITIDRYLSDKEKEYLPTYEKELAERALKRAEEDAAKEALRAAAAAMDEKRQNAEYSFSLGDKVQFGMETYTILGYDENTVILSDPKFPLLSENMPRDVFERRLRENPANDHLIKEVVEESPEETSPYLYAVDDVVYLDNKEFRITEVSEREVQLLDLPSAVRFGRSGVIGGIICVLHGLEHRFCHHPMLPMPILALKILRDYDLGAIFPDLLDQIICDLIVQKLVRVLRTHRARDIAETAEQRLVAQPHRPRAVHRLIHAPALAACHIECGALTPLLCAVDRNDTTEEEYIVIGMHRNEQIVELFGGRCPRMIIRNLALAEHGKGIDAHILRARADREATGRFHRLDEMIPDARTRFFGKQGAVRIVLEDRIGRQVSAEGEKHRCGGHIVRPRNGHRSVGIDRTRRLRIPIERRHKATDGIEFDLAAIGQILRVAALCHDGNRQEQQA